MNKQQKLEYNRVLSIYRKDHDPNYPSSGFLDKYLKVEIDSFLDIYNRKLNYIFCFTNGIRMTAMETINYSFLSYFLDENINSLINGLYTCGRLLYLSNLVEQSKYSQHLPDLIYASAINDKELIKAYLANFSGPFDDEFNKVWKIMTKSIYLILNENKNQEDINSVRNEIGRLLGLKSVQQYLKSFLKCFDDIITHNYGNFSEHLNEVLKLHSKIDDFYNTVSWTSLYALAFYNLAYFDKDRKTPMPAEPVHPLWDSELWHKIIKDNQKREYIIDVEKVSPVLKKWMDTLPAKIDFEELV